MFSSALFAILLSAGAQELMVPEGTVLPVVLNETISTVKLQENDPILFTMADDVHAGGHRGPILIPRGSSVVGRVIKSDRAGHFIGRSQMDIRVQEIITPTGEVYDGISTKIVDVGKIKGEKGEVRANGEIQGPVHRERDTFLLLFPPTALFQLLATPKRGPDVVLPVETRLYVKLMSPIYVETRVAVGSVAPPPAPAPVAFPVPQVRPQAVPRLSSTSLETLVTPIALYPDAILRNLLTACTHPLEIVQANQWVHQVRSVGGPYNGGYGQWDSSVEAIAGYPDLLQRLSSDINWTTNLGAAFTAQPAEVLNAVQRMRLQANVFRSPSRNTVLRP
jgi:hypothetical protein